MLASCVTKSYQRHAPRRDPPLSPRHGRACLRNLTHGQLGRRSESEGRDRRDRLCIAGHREFVGLKEKPARLVRLEAAAVRPAPAYSGGRRRENLAASRFGCIEIWLYRPGPKFLPRTSLRLVNPQGRPVGRERRIGEPTCRNGTLVAKLQWGQDQWASQDRQGVCLRLDATALAAV